MNLFGLRKYVYENMFIKTSSSKHLYQNMFIKT